MRVPTHQFIARSRARKRITLLMLLVVVSSGMLASAAALA